MLGIVLVGGYGQHLSPKTVKHHAERPPDGRDDDYRRRVLAAVPDGVEVRLLENDDAVMHFVLPIDPNAALRDDALESVVGGASIRSAQEYSSLATLSTIPSCAGSASTVKP